jgi:hypothetical protein
VKQYIKCRKFNKTGVEVCTFKFKTSQGRELANQIKNSLQYGGSFVVTLETVTPQRFKDLFN